MEFNTGKVEDMDNMFSSFRLEIGCLDLTNFDTRRVRTMTNMFRHCDTVGIDIRNFRSDSLITTENMFIYCRADEINMTNFKYNNVKDTRGMFDNCMSNIIK